MKLVKIHGLQRTGTNYAATMIRKNFAGVWVSSGAGGSKHEKILLLNASLKKLKDADRNSERLKKALAIRDEGQACFLVMTKDPYSWISSYAYFRKTRFGASSNVVTERNIKQWMRRYNRLNKHYLNSRNKHKNVLVTRYEDWVADYASVLKVIQKTFHLRPLGGFQNHTTIIKPKGESTHRPFNRAYYIRKLWRHNLSPEIKQWVTKYCCEEMLKFYGYH